MIWSAEPFGFVRLSDQFSTGSSIMPQKRNPDAAELVRAKSGRIVGALTGLLIVLKGLPLAYAKDLQEDKEPVFDAVDSLALCVAAMAGMVETAEFDGARLRAAAGKGFAGATDLADWLVRVANIPFRRAHHITGALVKMAESRGCQLEDLPLVEMQADRAADHRRRVLGARHRAVGGQPHQRGRHRPGAGPRRRRRGETAVPVKAASSTRPATAHCKQVDAPEPQAAFRGGPAYHSSVTPGLVPGVHGRTGWP